MTTVQLAGGQIQASRAGQLGRIILNRPEAINALNLPMVRAIRATLDEWAHDPDIETVVLTGAGERGLCAGGDVVSMTSGEGGALASAAQFLATEYRLNAAIADYPKPFVAIMDGIVLGGGIGLSSHGSHCVVTERSRLGMPETGIGFIPDVGGTWLLTRRGGHLGTHLALTGAIVPAADGIAAGLADVMIPSDSIPLLLESLKTLPPDAALARYVIAPPESTLTAQARWIDAAYAAPTVPEVLHRLRAAGVAEATHAADTIETKSPSAVLATFEALARARSMTRLEQALNQEFRAELHLAIAPDFAEGVRAQLVDKDRSPRWNPPSIDAVDPHSVARTFDAVEGFADPFDLTRDLSAIIDQVRE